MHAVCMARKDHMQRQAMAASQLCCSSSSLFVQPMQPCQCKSARAAIVATVELLLILLWFASGYHSAASFAEEEESLCCSQEGEHTISRPFTSDSKELGVCILTTHTGFCCRALQIQASTDKCNHQPPNYRNLGRTWPLPLQGTALSLIQALFS
jgi:hypothetical protein